jgi:hypothetical protein
MNQQHSRPIRTTTHRHECDNCREVRFLVTTPVWLFVLPCGLFLNGMAVGQGIIDIVRWSWSTGSHSTLYHVAIALLLLGVVFLDVVLVHTTTFTRLDSAAAPAYNPSRSTFQYDATLRRGPWSLGLTVVNLFSLFLNGITCVMFMHMNGWTWYSWALCVGWGLCVANCVYQLSTVSSKRLLPDLR